MEWLNKLNLIGNYMLIGGSLLVAIGSPVLFYVKHARQFEKEYPSLSNGEFNWLIWPAIAANYLFVHLFGKRGTRIRDLITWRSIGVTFLISFFTNLICVILVLISIPDDLPRFDIRLTKILASNYFVFIMFNFFGDFISVSFTRYVLSLIVAGKCNFIRYLKIDFLGIVLGYLITFLPTLLIVTYCWLTGDEINKWINAGLLGNALMPFFLFIFATTTMPFPFPIFAFLAVFTITIPTVIYLSLIAFCYFGYRIYFCIWKGKEVSPIEGASKVSIGIGKFLLYLASLLLALGWYLTAIKR